MGEFNWKWLLDHLIIVEGECMDENYGKGCGANESDEECNAGIREAYAQLVKVQPVLLAAPELLAAARLANQELIDLGAGSSGSPALVALWAAIAKAEGGTE